MKKPVCKEFGLPIITVNGISMTCDKSSEQKPSGSEETQTLVLHRPVRLCNCLGHQDSCDKYVAGKDVPPFSFAR